MPPAWIENSNPNEFLAQLERCAIRKNGEVRFAIWSHDDMWQGVQDSIKLSDDIHSAYKRRIVRNAIFAAAKRGPLSRGAVAEQVEREEVAIRGIPLTRFVVVSSLSIDRHRTQELTPRLINGIRVAFGPLRGTDRSTLATKLKGYIVGANPSDFTRTKLFVDARSAPEAALRALDTLQFLRSLWNFAINRRSTWRFSTTPSRINRIVAGPVHTIHEPNGILATQEFFYEDWYKSPPRATRLEGHFTAMMEIEQQARRMLRRHQYKDVMQRWLIHYVQAMDESRYETAILKLWALLENMTDAKAGVSHDEVVKRATAIYEDHQYKRAILNNLRQCRNSIVHRSYVPERREGEIKMYQLKRYVEDLLEFHIVTRFRFKTPAECAEFISQPTDTRQIRRRLKLLEQVLRFRGVRGPAR